MRTTILLTATLLLLPLAVPNAAASSTCGGPWITTASCAFLCDSPNVAVRGHADNPGAIAWLKILAECGIVDPTTGAFTVLFTVSCGASAPGTATCWNIQPNPNFPVPLVGRCTVWGDVKGHYSCSSF